MKIIELNICSIKLQTSNLKDEIQTLRLINVYNSCSLSIIFTEESSTISRLNELIKNDCKQLIVEDFSLHHSYWRDRRCYECIKADKAEQGWLVKIWLRFDSDMTQHSFSFSTLFSFTNILFIYIIFFSCHKHISFESSTVSEHYINRSFCINLLLYS